MDIFADIPDAITINISPFLGNGPELWNQILAQLPGAIVAGGAVRDYLLGVEPRDVDVFVAAPDYPSVVGFEPLGDDRREEYVAMTQIMMVTRGQVGRYQVDLVGIDPWPPSGRLLVQGFDFGVSRCWFDGELHDTAEASVDRHSKVVTMLLTDREERSRTRFDRFNERMGGGWALKVAA